MHGKHQMIQAIVKSLTGREAYFEMKDKKVEKEERSLHGIAPKRIRPQMTSVGCLQDSEILDPTCGG